MEDAFDSSDAVLVRQSLSGNREAFVRIVARYQTLVCSLAYSETGGLSRSEDLAQETFLAAFQQLAGLREPQKLRSWLCGIARNRIYHARDRQGRNPTHAAQPIDTLGVSELPAPEPQPREAAISREEQAILWQAVERVPEIYREPLILFYREHGSVETVAAQLDLTEDAVKQRLSRGRKLLQEQVLAFVEGALEQTSPGHAFTLGVLAALAALPAMSIPAKAATLGAAGKGIAAAKGVTLATVLAFLTGPLINVFGGFISYKLYRKPARTPREIALVKRNFLFLFLTFYVPFPLFMACLGCDSVRRLILNNPWAALPIIVLIPFGWFVFFFAAIGRFERKFIALRADEQERHPELFPKETLPPIYEYRSRATFLGLPLVHICYRRQYGVVKMKPAVGWIAIGDIAYGILFACGGVAVGGVSLGAVGIGIVSAGTVSCGLLAMGVIALGAFANGFLAVGLVTSAYLTIAIPSWSGRFPYTADWKGWGGVAICMTPTLLYLFLSILTKRWVSRKVSQASKPAGLGGASRRQQT